VPNDFESAIDGSVCDAIFLLPILDKRPQNIHVDISETISTKIRVELLKVRLVVKQTTFVSVVFYVLDNRVLPLSLYLNSGSGSLIGICLQAY
jgi:hypothetical protein